ncbi:MAG: hypothetical protein ACLTXM_09235 [Enterococcus sp.]
MKKVFLGLVLLFFLTGCGNSSKEPESSESTKTIESSSSVKARKRTVSSSTVFSSSSEEKNTLPFSGDTKEINLTNEAPIVLQNMTIQTQKITKGQKEGQLATELELKVINNSDQPQSLNKNDGSVFVSQVSSDGMVSKPNILNKSATYDKYLDMEISPKKEQSMYLEFGLVDDSLPVEISIGDKKIEVSFS